MKTPKQRLCAFVAAGALTLGMVAVATIAHEHAPPSSAVQDQAVVDQAPNAVPATTVITNGNSWAADALEALAFTAILAMITGAFAFNKKRRRTESLTALKQSDIDKGIEQLALYANGDADIGRLVPAAKGIDDNPGEMFVSTPTINETNTQAPQLVLRV